MSSSTRWTAYIGTGVTATLIVAFFLGIRSGKLQPFLVELRDLGLLGIVLSILLLAILCILPVPSEFLIIWNMEVYGVWAGIFYSWIGGILGAVGAMMLSRWLAQSLVKRFTGKYLRLARIWILRQGWTGLLTIRFIPFVPYHLVNYAAGALRAKLWPFVWTTALGILPFDLAMAGMFAGIRHGAYAMATIGGLIFVGLLLVGRRFQKRWKVVNRASS